MQTKRAILLGAMIGLVMAVLTGVWVWATGDDEPVDSVDLTGESVATGEAFPDVDLVDLNGDDVSIEDYAGVPVVVNLWAESCRPCRAEMPAFEAVFKERNSEVLFLGINSGDDQQTTADFVDEVGVTYDIARDPRGDVMAEVGGPGLPATLFVSAEGRILDLHFGEMSADELRAEIDRLLT